MSVHENNKGHCNSFNKAVLVPTKGDDTFTEQEKYILRNTWKLISLDRQERGMAIFFKIFKEFPHAKALFPFKDCKDNELKQNAMFRSHALRFINVMDTTIQNIDALQVALVPVLHNLGKVHGLIDGFELSYLPIFMNAILEVFKGALGKDWNNDVARAWIALADFIAAKVTERYDDSE